ncbi:hypothetical protein N7468_009494 [Penicillium chermesinum]|uniref:Uncharacterized protein n=1 Tax=Penicillium chermesinum TaxID=63820 RepID=A0A9W9NHX7_9EURO|nr:uncharacterized protein N7468_009494 [Penicillium chermesinum]KAJ5220290.1 hypothetical protein N7468_009494 [Penicillium chermesinum]
MQDMRDKHTRVCGPSLPRALRPCAHGGQLQLQRLIPRPRPLGERNQGCPLGASGALARAGLSPATGVLAAATMLTISDGFPRKLQKRYIRPYLSRDFEPCYGLPSRRLVDAYIGRSNGFASCITHNTNDFVSNLYYARIHYLKTYHGCEKTENDALKIVLTCSREELWRRENDFVLNFEDGLCVA